MAGQHESLGAMQAEKFGAKVSEQLMNDEASQQHVTELCAVQGDGKGV